MQTILGSGGAIGIPLAKELKNYSTDIRLVSRNPQKVNDTDELFPCDVNDFAQVEKAIAGSHITYVTIGFTYNTKVWQTMWLPFMQTVVNACKKHNSKLVFFDNVYMYAPSAIPFMTESSPIAPSSKKGEIRKQIHELIINEVERKNLTALIARAADFYGPDNRNSALGEMVVKRLLQGKSAQSFGNVNKIHTYTYTPDAAKATALLGNTSDAYNQVWHVPTTNEKLTNKQWIELIAKELNQKSNIQHVPTWLVHVLGLFIPVMREFPEMMYQYEQDYIFDSSKFNKRFATTATAPNEGIKQMIAQLKQ